MKESTLMDGIERIAEKFEITPQTALKGWHIVSTNPTFSEVEENMGHVHPNILSFILCELDRAEQRAIQHELDRSLSDIGVFDGDRSNLYLEAFESGEINSDVYHQLAGPATDVFSPRTRLEYIEPSQGNGFEGLEANMQQIAELSNAQRTILEDCCLGGSHICRLEHTELNQGSGTRLGYLAKKHFGVNNTQTRNQAKDIRYTLEGYDAKAASAIENDTEALEWLQWVEQNGFIDDIHIDQEEAPAREIQAIPMGKEEHGTWRPSRTLAKLLKSMSQADYGSLMEICRSARADGFKMLSGLSRDESYIFWSQYQIEKAHKAPKLGHTALGSRAIQRAMIGPMTPLKRGKIRRFLNDRKDKLNKVDLDALWSLVKS